jgi:hypothetical protein
MKKLLMCIVVIFAAMTLVTPSHAFVGDDDHSNTGPNTGVQNTGTMNGSNHHNNFGSIGITGGEGGIINNNANANVTGGTVGDTVGGDVTNTNTNTNSNLNLNMQGQDQSQGQSQGQGQGQEQGQSQSAVAEQGQGQAQSLTFDQTFESAEIPRQFAIGADIIYPGTPTYFGPATNQPNYVKADIFLAFKKTFTREDVESALSSHRYNLSSRLKTRFHYYTGDKASSARKQSDSLTVVVAKPDNAKSVGFMNIWSKSVDKDSLDVFYAALEKMLNVEGGNTVWITGEGAMSLVKSFGWGIGLNYTQAFVTSDNKQSGSGTGGTGISGGEAGYRAKPWLQIQLLSVE